MRKLLTFGLLFVVGSLYAGTLADPFSDKSTGNSLTAAEINTFKNSYRTVINGNLDATNLATNAVDTDELTADSVIPSKVDEDNTTPFVVRELTVTTGITASTMTATSTGTFAVANITTVENSPTFTYGLSASTMTVTTMTVTAVSSFTVTGSMTYHQPQTRFWSAAANSFSNDVQTGWSKTAGYAESSHANNPADGWALVNLPEGAIVTTLRAYWSRDDAAASGDCDLVRVSLSAGAEDIMATADSDASAGNNTVTDSSISNATIANNNCAYYVYVTLDPNDAATDVKLRAVVIDYTVTSPLD